MKRLAHFNNVQTILLTLAFAFVAFIVVIVNNPNHQSKLDVTLVWLYPITTMFLTWAMVIVMKKAGQFYIDDAESTSMHLLAVGTVFVSFSIVCGFVLSYPIMGYIVPIMVFVTEDNAIRLFTFVSIAGTGISLMLIDTLQRLKIDR